MNYKIKRPKLDELLEKSLSTPLTTVVAAPGYGKTTAVTSFAESVDIPVLWITLSELDNDREYFWKSFIHAVTVSDETYARHFEGQSFPTDTENFLTIYLNLLEQRDTLIQDVLIVYDNFELLENPDIMSYIGKNLTLTNLRLHHILISNEKMDKVKNPFYMQYLTPGDYNRITEADLIFNVDDAEKLLSLYNLEGGEYSATELVERSDGWPIFISHYCECGNINKTYLVLYELFENHFFSNYPLSMQMALIKISILSDFDLNLANEVLRSEGDETLTSLTRNIFIYYNFDLETFHMQKVYRHFLQNKIIIFDEEERRRIWNLAADYALRNDNPDGAIEYYMLAKNFENLLECLSEARDTLHCVSKSANIQAFFSETPSGLKKNNPRIDFYIAYTYVSCSQVNFAKLKFEELLDEELLKKVPNHKLIAEIHRSLADISLIKNNLEGMDHLQKAAAIVERELPVFSQSPSMVDENHLFFLPDGDEHTPKDMIAYIDQYMCYRNIVCKNSDFGYEHLFEAEAFYYSGKFRESKVAAKLAISKSLLIKQYNIAMQAHYLLSLIALSERDYATMFQEAEQINNYFTHDEASPYRQLRDILNASFYLEVDDSQRIESWIKENNFDAYEEHPLKKGRNYLVGAIYNLHIGDYSRAHTMLFQMEPLFEQKGLWVLRVYYYLIKSIFFANEKQREKSVSYFAKLYQMIYKYNLYMPVVELGALALPAISMARLPNPYDFNYEWLKDLESKTRAGAENRKGLQAAYKNDQKKLQHNVSNLTKRERNVLSLLSQGYTRNEIAEAMGISINGVKKFINSIYNKLGAKNRADAIYIATQNHII
ncbi:LuxR family maltose regulon positive regulatory protein [Lachnospiraceae bacterium PM6-15]|uniref:helix-turn-helix transcriptional regulator n=1 Tax=Ohessyouella blattaphilus TaxID=2949333 RepID=UPI003E1EE60D